MKLFRRFIGLALLLLCAGCAVEGGYGGGYGGVYGEYPASGYGTYSPAYAYPAYPYSYPVGPYDRDHYWDRRRHWERHRWHGDEHWGY
jgi:hypothetical protein